MTKVVAQRWIESERGWGTRPDGVTLHLTDKQRQEFIAAYWREMPDTPPSTYSRPSGEPFEQDISDEWYAVVAEAGDGVWLGSERLLEHAPSPLLVHE